MRNICIDLFRNIKNIYANQSAYYAKQNGHYTSTSWNQYYDQVQAFAAGLVALDHNEGESVSILSFNRPEWSISCIGTQMAGGVSTGIYTTSSPEEVCHVVAHSESKILVVENSFRFDKQVKSTLHQMTHLKNIVFMDHNLGSNTDIPSGITALNFADLLKLGLSADRKAVHKRVERIDPKSTCAMIYTSGTTGPSKAVMLSHSAISWTVQTACTAFQIGTQDSMLSYLPMAHVAEQMFAIYAPISSGMCVYFAESMEKLPANIKEVQPTIFFGVPRVYEKFHEKVYEKMESVSRPKAMLLNWARGVATSKWQKEYRSVKVSSFTDMKYRLAKRLVFDKLKHAMGFANARVCVAGAAPISAEILSFFTSLDIPVYEIYGQSEDCGPTSLNVPGATKLGTVGMPYPGVSVKIASDGEILVKGPNLFNGYFKDSVATDETLVDGWMHTADIGELDVDGYLKITDRKKDLLITAGGKNISPQNIEAMLKEIPFVGSAVVVGDGRKYLSALLTLKEKNNAIDGEDKITSEIGKWIAKINSKLAPVEQIKRFSLLKNDFTIENGELTPTLKIKRKVIKERYQKEIELLYV